MNGTDLLVLLPIIILAASAVCVMMMAAFRQRHGVMVLVSVAGLLLSFSTLGPAASHVPRVVTPLLVVDNYAVYFIGLILAATVAVTALAYDYIQRRSAEPGEFYVLLLTASLGAAVLSSSRHLASFFLGVELLSIPLFAMIAYLKRDWAPLEAGTKYLVLSGVSSAFLLFGMALVYGGAGAMTFSRIAASLAHGQAPDLYVYAGIAMILVGLGFKLSLVPFHMWVADVYQGAPAPVAAYISTISKGAVFVVLLRYFTESGAYHIHAVAVMLTLMAVASMVVGNLLALFQNNIKRILAYSSIAHMGYLMVALVSGGPVAVEAVGYYLAAYFVTMIGAFGVVTHLSTDGEGDADSLEDYRGLYWRRPWLAGIFTAMLLSLAGIPVTMGFVAKFYVMAAGVNGASWLLVYALIVASAVGLYYYLRIVITLYRPVSERVREVTHLASPIGGRLVLLVMTLLLVLLGVYPGPLIDLLHATAVTLE